MPKRLLPLLEEVEASLPNTPSSVALKISIRDATAILRRHLIDAPHTPALGDLELLKQSFTGSGEKICKCCGRPLDSR